MKVKKDYWVSTDGDSIKNIKKNITRYSEDEESTSNIPIIPLIKPQNILQEFTPTLQRFIKNIANETDSSSQSSSMDGQNTPPIKNSTKNEFTYDFKQDKLQKALRILSPYEKLIELRNGDKLNAKKIESRKRLCKQKKQQTLKQTET